jgi:hypothetical protein
VAISRLGCERAGWPGRVGVRGHKDDLLSGIQAVLPGVEHVKHCPIRILLTASAPAPTRGSPQRIAEFRALPSRVPAA